MPGTLSTSRTICPRVSPSRNRSAPRTTPDAPSRTLPSSTPCCGQVLSTMIASTATNRTCTAATRFSRSNPSRSFCRTGFTISQSWTVQHEVAFSWYNAGMNKELLSRITIESGKCGGRPCIRGKRIRVMDVLELLGAGASFDEILRDYPFLEREDILAALIYAARQTDHDVLT